MKPSVFIALIFYVTGVLHIIDWFVFWTNNQALAKSNYQLFKLKYIDHFPGYIQPLHKSNPEPATIILLILFAVSGFIFLKESSRVFKILSISSFLFISWLLFSLM